MSEDIKKIVVFKDQLSKVDAENNHVIRFRITTDDLSRTSEWSPYYQMPGAQIQTVSGKATQASGIISFAWDDANGRPEYDIFISFGNTITFRSLTNNVATIITQNAHGLSQGDIINVEGTGAPTIDGTNLTILSTPAANSITYTKTAANVANAAATAGSGVYEAIDTSQGSLSAYSYHGSSPIHTYSVVKPANIDRVKFIVQVSSYENTLSSLIEIYPGLGTYTESFSV